MPAREGGSPHPRGAASPLEAAAPERQHGGMPLLFSRPRSSRAGATLDFETLVADRAPLRVLEHEDTLLRVIAGEVRLVVDGVERLLATGEEAIVPAGVRHRLSAAEREARVVLGFRPS